MRYRRFGRSELEVSEVGFGVWTLAWPLIHSGPHKHAGSATSTSLNHEHKTHTP